jgi:hypothetical protein
MRRTILPFSRLRARIFRCAGSADAAARRSEAGHDVRRGRHRDTQVINLQVANAAVTTGKRIAPTDMKDLIARYDSGA